MSRLVLAKPKHSLETIQASDDGEQSQVKDYMERVGKYVPAEILAAYTTINGLFANSGQAMRFWGLLISTIALWVFTPIYFYLMKKPTDETSALRKQQWVSFFSFIIWAYMISGNSGIFGEKGLDIFYNEIGSTVLIFFTLVSGAIIPRK